MQIDWITVSAQIVNFLILVWLLKQFLYQPVVRAIDRREERIAARLNDAQVREQQADEKMHSYQDKADELERSRDEILSQARQQAELQKRQLLEDARAEVAETRANWQQQANEEKDEFLADLRRQAATAIQAIARKALRDLADAELEEHVVRTFLARLKSLDRETREALAHTAEPVRITSAFPLASRVRGRVTRAIHEHLAEGIEVDYRQSPDVLCGIELTSGGRRLSWTLADYMEELTARIEAVFSPIELAKEEA
jgi:F-type H+-transporting ATPase subunit b